MGLASDHVRHAGVRVLAIVGDETVRNVGVIGLNRHRPNVADIGLMTDGDRYPGLFLGVLPWTTEHL